MPTDDMATSSYMVAAATSGLAPSVSSHNVLDLGKVRIQKSGKIEIF